MDEARDQHEDDGVRPRPSLRAALSRRRFLAVTTGAAVAGAGAVAAVTAAGRSSTTARGAGSGTDGADLTAATAAAPVAGKAAPQAVRRLYLGTYTTSSSGGVGIASYDPGTGALTSAGKLAGVANPSFLALSPSGTHLYAVDEQSSGAVTAIAVDAQGGLKSLGSQRTGGSGPCHLSVHPAGKHVLSANYDSGSVSVHPLASDGRVLARTDLVQHTGSGPDPDRQEGPHAHMVLSDPAGGFVLAVDLGTDSVYTYRLNQTTGKLASVSQARVTAGSGPRHLAFHPSGAFGYVANELGNSVIVCAYNASTGALVPGSPQPTVPAGSPPGERNYPAEVLVSHDGAFVYVSNRGHNSVARFAVTDGGATLTLLDAVPTGGAYPRHISFDPTGTLLFAANQNSGTVTGFHVDTTTGALTRTATSYAAPTPVCVLPT